MARLTVFEGGNIERQGTTGARYRAADFGPSPLAAGLEALGKTGTAAVQALDEIEDVRARVEANRLAVEHAERVRLIGRRVKETQGEGAEAVALEAGEELKTANDELLGNASPRARLLLESDVASRTGVATDSWLDHGYQQKGVALETTSKARIKSVVENAADEDDEDKALALLAEVPEVNARRASFFGWGEEQLEAENNAVVSDFYRSRALKLARGEGGANAAVQYAIEKRAYLDDADYDAIVNSFQDEALRDRAFAMAHGYDAPVAGATVEEVAPDPLALPDAQPARVARADPATIFDNLIIPNEGTVRVMDNNGAWAKFGINEAFNPGVDTRTLTKAGAQRIFVDKYWKPSGADQLSPALAAMHIDTYYLNPTRAKRILRDSGGDPDRYMDLRRQFLGGLHRSDPQKYPNYENRNKRVEAFAAQLETGEGLPSVNIQVNTSVESIRDKVFATPGVSMKFKRYYYDALVAKRNGLRQEREERESEAGRLLTTAVLSLGDDFTSITQLPAELVTQASPATLSALTNAAKSNKESRPLSPQVSAKVGFIQAFKPELFTDPKVQQDLLKSGLSPQDVSQLAGAGGRAMGAAAGAKPDPIPRSTLESIARPAFEAAGHFLWTTEESGSEKNRDKATAERQREAQQQQQLLGFLNSAATEWAVTNPGKRPDEATMQKWVGAALLQSQRGPVGTLNDSQLVLSMSEHDRREIRRRLESNGLVGPGTPASRVVSLTAQYYRQNLIARGGR